MTSQNENVMSAQAFVTAHGAQRINAAIISCIESLKLHKRSNLYDAKDLVQEVWVRLLSDGGSILHKYDFDRGVSLEYYISMVTRREISNLIRKEKSLTRGGRHRCATDELDMDIFVGSTPEPILEARDTMVKLSRWLQQKGLSAEEIDVLKSTLSVEKPIEIAERLGISRQLVYNWQHKIRALSRRFINRTEASMNRWSRRNDLIASEQL